MHWLSAAAKSSVQIIDSKLDSVWHLQYGLCVSCAAVCNKGCVPRHGNDGTSADRRPRAHVPESRSRRNGVDDDDPGDHAYTFLGERGKQQEWH